MPSVLDGNRRILATRQRIAKPLCQSRNIANVSVVYANTPGVELRGVRSERHVGAATISTHGAKYKPDSLTAEYWTDRRTVGRMTFEGRVPTVYSRYEDAKRNLG